MISPNVLRTMCNADLEDYPTDEHKCELVFGSWGHDAGQIRSMVRFKPRLHLYNFCYDFRCDFLLVMDVNEWMRYECSDESTCTQNIGNSSARSDPSEEENRTRNRSKICKQSFTIIIHDGLLQYNFHNSTMIIGIFHSPCKMFPKGLLSLWVR